MCGIVALFDPKRQSSAYQLERAVADMTSTLAHRGPDGHGTWAHSDSGVALGHRRLSIIDLSSSGQQPMHSSSGQFVISYNGEIYNSMELRVELEEAGVKFRGYSDTEVLLEACSIWGPKETAQKLIGMFAFALWDRNRKSLWLARDRLGIKPLYWSMTSQGVFIAASELKALRAHPSCPNSIDPRAVAAFACRSYVPDNLCIYKGVNKVAPGEIIEFSRSHTSPTKERFWTLDEALVAGKLNCFEGSDADAQEQFEALLTDAIERRMVSDVPLGAFLSGGFDSSLVVALMQNRHSNPVRTFTIGFSEDKYDEASHAKAVAAYLGTNHTELYVTPEQAQSVIPKMPLLYDEPFADSSQIPTYLVATLTRNDVTVVLSGDGGDELFGGYERYFDARKFNIVRQFLPFPINTIAATFLKSTPLNFINSFFVNNTSPKSFGRTIARIFKLADVLHLSGDEFYDHLMCHWPRWQQLAIGNDGPPPLLEPQEIPAYFANRTERMQFIDTLTYLPGDILTKVDRATMGASLEARVPILDHRIVEFSWTLPTNMKIRNGQGKWLLRQLLYKYVPKALVNRPKMGFGVPIDSWLRGPLREWAGDMLSPDRLKRSNLIQCDPVQEKWSEHLSGKRDWHYLLWDILMLECWHDEWG